MDENKIARFRPVLGGGSRRGWPVWGLSRFVEFVEFVETEPKGRCCVLMLGKCARVRSQKQSALVSRQQKIRRSGQAWNAPRGDNSRYIFHFRKTLIKYTNGGGSPPGCVSCGVQPRRGRKQAAIGPMSLCIFTAVCQCGSHCFHPGTRDPRPPFLCEIAPDAGPVISRTWSSQR
jgi:hypothetical protein